MTAKILAIGDCMPDTKESCKDVIAFLESLLEQARAGEVIGIAYAFVRGNDAVANGWISGRADRHDMISGVSLLQYRIVSEVWERQEND